MRLRLRDFCLCGDDLRVLLGSINADLRVGKAELRLRLCRLDLREAIGLIGEVPFPM